jgi:hypothetical protein
VISREPLPKVRGRIEEKRFDRGRFHSGPRSAGW